MTIAPGFTSMNKEAKIVSSFSQSTDDWNYQKSSEIDLNMMQILFETFCTF